MATLVEIAAQIVAAHAASTPMNTDQLLEEIDKVHSALKRIESGVSAAPETPEKKPVMSPKESFKKNEVVCLICGKGGFKTLSRHLSTAHQIKPGAYKKQFGIPGKQSLSAKSYSEARRKMAQDRGLAENLSKAREVRMANLEAKKAGPKKKGQGRKPKATGATTA